MGQVREVVAAVAKKSLSAVADPRLPLRRGLGCGECVTAVVAINVMTNVQMSLAVIVMLMEGTMATKKMMMMIAEQIRVVNR